MGTFSVSIEVGDPQPNRWETVAAALDRGSTCTWIPSDVLGRLGVRPHARYQFETADQRVVERQVGRTWVRYDGQMEMTLVVFADAGSEALLGAYTLEGFLLGVDPAGQRLVPVRGWAR